MIHNRPATEARSLGRLAYKTTKECVTAWSKPGGSEVSVRVEAAGAFLTLAPCCHLVHSAARSTAGVAIPSPLLPADGSGRPRSAHQRCHPRRAQICRARYNQQASLPWPSRPAAACTHARSDRHGCT
eukprot:2666508-Prymnesium_polylepis.1